MKEQHVIIIGGGAAGLTAARLVSSKAKVTIIESRDRLGGRIRTDLLPDAVIEAGAEFIHGHLPLTLALLKEAGAEHVPVKGRMYRKERGQWKEQEDIMEGWDELIKKMKDQEEDLTMQQFL